MTRDAPVTMLTEQMPACGSAHYVLLCGDTFAIEDDLITAIRLAPGRRTRRSGGKSKVRELAEPLIPPSKMRPHRGGARDTPDRTPLAAITYMSVSGARSAAVIRGIEPVGSSRC
ncbi:hypothetical protein [Actinacidiphila sp. bgisy160]|uniref:hypothetical protein n=1 Tax=Actinacidiphila sp. bgisy160 TaxID=3413796 RepID=UPI003D706E80